MHHAPHARIVLRWSSRRLLLLSLLSDMAWLRLSPGLVVDQADGSVALASRGEGSRDMIGTSVSWAQLDLLYRKRELCRMPCRVRRYA